jgi:hypothetical protein
MIVVSSVQRFVGLNGKATTPTNPVSLSPTERQIVQELRRGVAS